MVPFTEPKPAIQTDKTAEPLNKFLRGTAPELGFSNLSYMLKSTGLSEPAKKQATDIIKQYGTGARMAVEYILSKPNSTTADHEAEIFNLYRFTNEMKEYASSDYFFAIHRTKAFDILMSEPFIKFAETIGGDCAESYFKIIGGTQEVELLTSKRVMDFVINAGTECVENYFNAIDVTKAVGILTSERIIEFAKSIGSDTAIGYFWGIAEAKNFEALTNKNITSPKFASLVKYLDRDSSYFAALGNNNDPILMERGAIAIAICVSMGFEDIIKAHGISRKAIEYYDRLSRSLKNIGEMKNVEVIYNEKFCDSALNHLDCGSSTLYVYMLAKAGYLMKSKRLADIDYDTMFSFGQRYMAQYIDIKSMQALTNLGVLNPESLMLDERIALMQNIHYTERNSDVLTDFIKRRRGKVKQISTFNAMEINAGIILEKRLTESKELDLDPKTALEMMVYALNGSRNNRTKKENARKILLDSGYFDNEELNAAIGGWESIKRPYQDRLAKAFSDYEHLPSSDNAMKVITLFRQASSGASMKTSMAIKSFIGKLEPLLIGESKKLSKGDRIVAYNDCKDNVLSIKSSETGACCFIGGHNQNAALEYALDDGISLINFTVVNSSMGFEELKKQKVYGVAICAFAVIKDTNKLVLLVDSFEGGITINKAINGDYDFVVDALKKFAKGTGCEAIAINTRAHNQTPRKFAAFVGGKIEEHPLSIMIKTKQCLETSRESAHLKIIYV